MSVFNFLLLLTAIACYWNASTMDRVVPHSMRAFRHLKVAIMNDSTFYFSTFHRLTKIYFHILEDERAHENMQADSSSLTGFCPAVIY